MPIRALPAVAAIAGMLVLPSTASAAVIGTFDLTSPGTFSFVLGFDFEPLTNSALGVAAGTVTPVDMSIPPVGTNSSTSGCEDSDFDGFVAGSIALMQRGTCTFEQKTANAAAAGAIAAIIFNRGDPGGMDLFSGTLINPSAIPVIAATFAVGQLLSQLPGATVRIEVIDSSPEIVPEPVTWWLVALGVGPILARRRRVVDRP